MINKIDLFKDNFFNKKSDYYILFLVTADILFIFVHVFTIFFWDSFDPLEPYFLMVNTDGGIAEYFQYLKYLTVMGTVIYIMIKTKELYYFFWLILFTLLLFDDALELHERIGSYFVVHFDYNSIFGLRPQDLGELTYASIVGFCLFIIFLLSYKYSNNKFKKASLDIGLLFGILLVFGIGVDMLHGVFNQNKYVNFVLVLIEDGGEMFAMSMICWYFYLNIIDERRNVYLYQFLSKN